MLVPKENETLALHTTLRVGGPARFFFSVRTLKDLAHALRFAEEKGLPTFVLGGGSNILCGDDGFPGVVLKMEILGRSYAKDGEDVLATAGAGEAWDSFVGETTRRGLWGLENLSAIPGTVGASPIQNIGAYGVEAEGVIAAIEVFDTKTKTTRVLQPAECHFAYRDSIFKHEEGAHLIVTSVTFRLAAVSNPKRGYADVEKILTGKTGAVTPRVMRDAIIEIRSQKLPSITDVGTAGSFFKNPIISSAQHEGLLSKWPDMASFPTGEGLVKIPIAWILDHVLHLNGYRKGNVGVWPTQALVVVNYGGATAREIDAFANAIAQKVFAVTGLRIEREFVTMM